MTAVTLPLIDAATAAPALAKTVPWMRQRRPISVPCVTV